MTEPVTKLNVGILSAAFILRRVWPSIHFAGHRVSLLGCRDVTRGALFVKEVCDALSIPEDQRPRITSYEEVITSNEVDIIYLPIPVMMRDEWVKKCIENNKHVVGEKPPAATAAQLREWIETLDTKELLYMDGTMFSHGQRVKSVVESAKTLGPIKHLHSNHCLNGSEEFFKENIRMFTQLEPHGALGDMGWYSIRYFLHIMEYRMPIEVTGNIIKKGGINKDAIIQFSGELTFDIDGIKAVASMFTTFDSMDEQTLTIAGTEGVLKLKDMCHPISGSPASWTITTQKTIPKECKWEIEQEIKTFTSEEETETQRNNMWEDIGRIIYRNSEEKLVAKEEERRYWATLAWKTQEIMDRMLESARRCNNA